MCKKQTIKRLKKLQQEMRVVSKIIDEQAVSDEWRDVSKELNKNYYSIYYLIKSWDYTNDKGTIKGTLRRFMEWIKANIGYNKGTLTCQK